MKTFKEYLQETTEILDEITASGFNKKRTHKANWGGVTWDKKKQKQYSDNRQKEAKKLEDERIAKMRATKDIKEDLQEAKKSPVPGLEYGMIVSIDPEAVEQKTKRWEQMAGKIVGIRHDGLRYRVTILTDVGARFTFNEVDVRKPKSAHRNAYE